MTSIIINVMENTVRYVYPLVFSLTLFAAHAAFAGAIGFKQTELPGAAGQRPLQVSLWYPTSADGPVEMVGANAAFIGLSVIRNAKPEAGPHPLVLLSHGMGGSWRNLSWLAGELTSQGYIVAAPDHPGTTTFDRRPPQQVELWQRPRDLSRVLDMLLADPALAGMVAPHRVAAIGHSLGGWTVIELAGGRFEADRLATDCPASRHGPRCDAFRQLGILGENVSAELGADRRDRRFGAVVSLDLGPAVGFTPESLSHVTIPVLIFAAGREIADIAAVKSDSVYLAGHLPSATTTYVETADAMHFSFMQICKPGAIALIEAETPGEGYVCKDGGSRSRIAIHRQVADSIMAFLSGSLPPQ